jgi:AcrR family transcriptional regulator
MLFLSEMPKEAREKILYAGLLRFTTDGFKATSVLEIVEMARVSKTTFYQNFSSKEELMAELLRVIAEEIFNEVRCSTDQEKRNAYKAYAGIRRYIEICFADMKAANLMLVESVGVSQEIEKVRGEAHRRFARLIFQTVQGQLPDTVSEMEMQIVSLAMVGAINEVVVQHYNQSAAVEYDELARLLNRIVISAFLHLGN